MPLITGTLPTYFNRSLSCAWGPSTASSKPSMKPSSERIWAMARLVRDAGNRTSEWRARLPLRMRVSMSAMGSEMFIWLPARLGHAGQLAHQRALAAADAAQPEAAHVGARTAAHEAPVVALARLVRLALLLGDE